MKTSIVGLGQTEFSTNSGRSELRLALEAIVAALADAGLEVNDIDGLVRYTWDNTSEAAIVNALGLPSLKYYGETEFGGVNCCGAIGNRWLCPKSCRLVERRWPSGSWARIWSCFGTTKVASAFWAFTVRTAAPI